MISTSPPRSSRHAGTSPAKIQSRTVTQRTGRECLPGEDTIRGLAALLETDEEMLLAMAGKVPVGLRDRARDDVEFARFLRRLPSIPDSKMREIYKELDIPPADQ